ncbi:MAG TPA: hypothetical protein VN905_13625 [Candidatus Binatia bacterium]|nr:hypothetical protein [Candidatus Binatia bacterium]
MSRQSVGSACCILAFTWWFFPGIFSHPTPTPAVQPTPKAAATHVPPQILRVDLSKSDIGAGDYVTGEVVTSDNVASVKVLLIGQTIDLTRKRTGHFPIYFTVPTPVPFFFKGPQSVEFVARNATGERVSKTISFRVH